MSEPISVVKVRNVLLVSMPADPDDSTVAALQDRTLEAMSKYDARALVLDLSKVEILDSYFARMVSETAQMVSLMGGDTIIAGMQPALAVTATELGVTLGRTRTAMTVERALEVAGQPRGSAAKLL
ncbi:MAG TPA: STAS domain-containing protein [Candidatus Acidoferrum sp.]|nr:STAS domain-containing protein [Candidatus Acidoferrum sp.]